MAVIEGVCRIVGGVDTHKDLHVAAIVDEQDRIIGTRSFATTRQGYRQMLAWMRSFGELQRIGIESTGSYGAGLLRFMQQAKVTVLEVTTPDQAGSASAWQERRSRRAERRPCRLCRPADRDAAKPGRHDQNFCGFWKACRKTAVSARRIALQMIHNTIVCAPDGLGDQLRSLTRMQLVRTLVSYLATRSYRLSRPGFRLSESAFQVPRPPLPRAA